LTIEGDARPRPGGEAVRSLDVGQPEVPVDVAGDGLFTLPFGPVRSGVFESIEFLIETPGEDIPHLNIRPHYKHRGVAKAFEGRSVDDGVLVAERVEGIASVAHALAFSHAIESLSGATVPARAALLRVVHAELERLANHLDATMRLADAAGLAVATARFGCHKEAAMRLVSAMCGSRFGRGVVVPGGVASAPAIGLGEIRSGVERLRRAVAADVEALQRSASFLDRLRGTGPLPVAMARGHGALGPVGRGSGFDDDHRRAAGRSYDGYPLLPAPEGPRLDAADALARARVRWHELETAARLIVAALDALPDHRDERLSVPVHVTDGFATGWAEAPQGEVLYAVDLRDRRIARCLARSASFHNLVLLHDVFAGDIFTDFPFIEASFGLSYAGVAM
jgi:Ni,Fe-hydrogenase III large subunit